MFAQSTVFGIGVNKESPKKKTKLIKFTHNRFDLEINVFMFRDQCHLMSAKRSVHIKVCISVHYSFIETTIVSYAMGFRQRSNEKVEFGHIQKGVFQNADRVFVSQPMCSTVLL